MAGIENSNNERLEYLDTIKSVAIFFVCFYHFNTLSSNFLDNPSLTTYFHYFITGVASAGVPIFFLVSGALMLNRGYDLKKHIKKSINISILTIVWAVITLVILIPIFNDSYNFISFAEALWNWKQQRINHLWYLPTLVIIYLLFPIIKEIYDKKDKRILCFFLVTVFIFTFGNVFLSILANLTEWFLNINYLEGSFNFFNIFNPFDGFYAYSVVYFIVGGLLLTWLKNDKVKYSNILLLFTVAFTTTLLFLYGIVLSFSNNKVYDTVWGGYDTIMTLIMALCIFVLASKGKIRNLAFAKLIKIIGTNTLGIYFLHVIVGSFLMEYYVLLPYNHNIFLNLLFGILILMASLLIALLLKKIPIVNRLFRI